MNLLLLMMCLVGCNQANVRPTGPAASSVESPSTVITAPEIIPPKEWEKLTKACVIPQVPADLKDKDPVEVAVDLANARKAALEECSKRMKELRIKLKGKKRG